MAERAEAQDLARVAEEMSRAASELHQATEALTRSGGGELKEGEADAFAYDSVRQFRRSYWRVEESGEAPTPEDVRRSREERRSRESRSYLRRR